MGNRKIVLHYADHTTDEVRALCGEKIIIGAKENKIALLPQEDMDKRVASLSMSAQGMTRFGRPLFSTYSACDVCKDKRSLWDLAHTDL